MEQIAEQIRSIGNRLANLEAAAASNQEDFSDPPLYMTRADGSAISPDTIEDIPDLVKGLPIFSGDPNELSAFIQDAGTLVRLYAPHARSSLDEKNKYHVVCKSIRRKIKGEANDALVASNVNINWPMIRKTLITYYGEKRDLETLDYQLMSSQQKGEPLEKYYDKINKTLSLIANSIRTDERFAHPEATKAMLYTYNKKAIDAFIRGLDGDIGRFLKNYEPDSLAAAYSYCITYKNIEFRKSLVKPRNESFTHHTLPPRLPPRMPITKPPFFRQQPFFQQQQRSFQQQPFFQHPRPFPNQQFFQNPKPIHQQPFQRPPNPPPNPQIPPRNPFRQPPPEPMDVDHSIRSRQVNYGNRPQNSFQNRFPAKRQRMFNAETKQYVDPQQDLNVNGFQDYYPSEDEEYYPEESSTYQRYIRQYNAQEREEPNEIENAELNFLE